MEASCLDHVTTLTFNINLGGADKASLYFVVNSHFRDDAAVTMEGAGRTSARQTCDWVLMLVGCCQCTVELFSLFAHALIR